MEKEHAEAERKQQQHQEILVFCGSKHVDTFFNGSLKPGDLTYEYGDNRRVMQFESGKLWIDVEDYHLYRKNVLGYQK
jgi:hypothetical protein